MVTIKKMFYSLIAVAPQRPKIEHRSSQVLPGHNLTVKAGERATVKCLSRYGNPPARLKWFLGKFAKGALSYLACVNV